MRKSLLMGLILALCSVPGYAQTAKSGVQLGGMNLVAETEATVGNPGWVTILGNESILAPDALRLHTSQQKDLTIGVSLECGIYTQTQVKSRGGNKETSIARATVQIRVKVDPGTSDERMAYPGGTEHNEGVTFCERYQELSAALQGILELACVDTDNDGQLDDCDLNVIDDEEIELVLQTLSANAFFYSLDDLGAGTHNIIVQAKVTSYTDGGTAGTANATALVGQGAITVEEVRFLKDADLSL